MTKALFTIGKTLEILGMLLLPLALFLGMRVPGGAGVSLELALMGVGILVFAVGRAVEGVAAGRS